MKNYFQLFAVLLFSITILYVTGCKKDSNTENEVGIEEPNLPSEMMTLSAIAYAGDSSSNKIITDSIIYYLKKESLTTKGKWKLAWGPGISSGNANLVYVVKNTTNEITSYAIAIRGTNVHSIGDILQDVIIKPTAFTYGMPGDSVSLGSMIGFTNIITSKDTLGLTTLEQYLESITSSTKIPLYITGHSQGGGLAPLVAYWLMNHEHFKDKFTFSTYAFAGPGWFNKNFRDNFLSTLPPDASFHMMVNSLDMIPYGYANLPGLIDKSIPVTVPSLYRGLITLAEGLLKIDKAVYYDIAVADTIGNFPITTNPAGTTIQDSINWYDHWLLVEHNHNNYLRLLGAVPLN